MGLCGPTRESDSFLKFFALLSEALVKEITPLDGEKMLKKMVQGKRMFVVLAGFIAALLGVGLARADIRGGVADTLGDYYQARAGMAPVEAEVEHPVPAGVSQLGGLEAEGPAGEEVEAKLEDEPGEVDEEADEPSDGEDGANAVAAVSDPPDVPDPDTDDTDGGKTSIPLPGGSDDTEADDDTDDAADAAANEDSADTEEQDD
jgi:hypothetical protein